MIAVDEDGNESTPALADTPSVAACPQTPPPPSNLRASTSAPGPTCKTKLEWDASPGATEYYVYRLRVANTFSYFYQTHRVVPTPSQPLSFVESQDDHYHCGTGTTPDNWCPYFNSVGQAMCGNGLEAFYVTARGATGGESPRSNLVFWFCAEPDGYVNLLTNEDQFDAIAARDDAPAGESLACWNTDVPIDGGLNASNVSREDPTSQTILAAAEMLRLGSLEDPPWVVIQLHTDHLGTVRAATTDPGVTNQTTRHDYFPFGEEITDQASYNSHEYTGHERDDETELDYMRARYYQWKVGRFLSSDPGDDTSADDPQSWNHYQYASSNPVRFVDLTGEAVESIDFENQGANLVPNPSAARGTSLSKLDMATLGPKPTNTGYFAAVNLIARVSEGDSPTNYSMNQESAFYGAVGGIALADSGPDNPERRNVGVTGSSLAMFDAPGAITTPPSPRDGTSVTLVMAFKTFATDKKTGKKSGNPTYWAVTIQHTAGKPATIKSGKTTKASYEAVKKQADAKKSSIKKPDGKKK